MQDLRLWKVQCPATPQMLVMATAEKKPLEQKALQAMMDAASERAGVRRLPSHRLRHTFGSLLIKASGDRDIPKLSRLLGQDNVAFSMKIYTHFIPDQDNTMQDFATWIAARAGGKKN